jgi:hypothetical protein
LLHRVASGIKRKVSFSDRKIWVDVHVHVIVPLRFIGAPRRQHPKAASKGRHNVARAFLRGALDSIMSPVKGRPSSKIRKIAEAAEKANSERQVKSVMFRGEKRL